jgi:hypothetical protein
MTHSFLKRLFGHVRIIARHRKYVRRACFAMGIPLRGIKHDLSKYSPKEFWLGVRYFDGKKSPIINERAARGGFSTAWVHHKNHNDHHWEYWLSSPTDGEQSFELSAAKMPYAAVIEMLCDSIGAGKAYDPKGWGPQSEVPYFRRNEPHRVYHPDTKRLFVTLLNALVSSGNEKAFYAWYRKNRKRLKKEYEKSPFEDPDTKLGPIAVK